MKDKTEREERWRKSTRHRSLRVSDLPSFTCWARRTAKERREEASKITEKQTNKSAKNMKIWKVFKFHLKQWF